MSTITQSPCKVRRRSPLSSTGGSTLCPTWIPRLERYNIWNKLTKNNIETFASCMVTEAIVKKICIWDIWWEFSSGLSTVHLKQMMEIDEGFDHYDKSISKKWVVLVCCGQEVVGFRCIDRSGFHWFVCPQVTLQYRPVIDSSLNEQDCAHVPPAIRSY